MSDNIKFKIRGVHYLLTYEQLIALEKNVSVNKVRVVDIQTQKNWETNFKTIVLKFG